MFSRRRKGKIAIGEILAAGLDLAENLLSEGAPKKKVKAEGGYELSLK